jgi:anti-sigma regulatory factor (Ser/Thr protein kinase)
MDVRDDALIGPAGLGVIRRRVTDVVELGGLRSVIADFLAGGDVEPAVVADVRIAVSELATNAIRASSGEWPVEVAVRIDDDGDVRTIVVTIDNAGDPFPGTLDVSPHLVAPPERRGGRGLMVAARLGAVRLEGRIGGTRAIFRRPL